MHYVDRGPEPRGIKKHRVKCTPRWVDYYERRIGSEPTDSHWTKFHNNLRETFSGLCGYCECECKGEVDHFRPKSKVPQRVYDWPNWGFSCHDCNNSKGNRVVGEGDMTGPLPEKTNFAYYMLARENAHPKAHMGDCRSGENQ